MLTSLLPQSVLLIHTHYQKLGGEDVVFSQEADLLERYGHQVFRLKFSNSELNNYPKWKQAAVTIWNTDAYHRVRDAIQLFRPQLVHVHNTFPLASPAVIEAIKDEGLPVMMTLHNFRLICLNALLFRQGRFCEDCVGRLPIPGIFHKCYRGRAESSVVAGMLAYHRWRGTWKEIDRYIALTPFTREKFIQAGFPDAKIDLKPNFVYPDPSIGDGKGRYVLYVGRLSVEKGIRTLLKAWQYLEGIPLKIIGKGPLEKEVQDSINRLPLITWMGHLDRTKVLDLIGGASFVVFPSECYEGMPMVLLESLAKGTPIIASDVGSIRNIIEPPRTGKLFKVGDVTDLVEKVESLWKQPDELKQMRFEARREYLTKYTAEKNYELLQEIYQKTIEK